MYPIDQTTLAKFQSGARQYARFRYQNYMFTDSIIIQGSMSVNRYCATGESVCVGSCVASELTVSLTNPNGGLNSFAFKGKKVTVEVGVETAQSTITYVPLGQFTIDDVKYDRSSITLTALDSMVEFDMAIDPTDFTFPYTLKTLLARICNVCGVSLGTTGNFTNYSYSVTALPEEAKTYRDILKWICELSGTNGYIGYDDKLYIDWYSTTSGFTMTTANRYSSEIDENTYSITGVTLIKDDVRYSAGTSTRPIVIRDNPLVTTNAQTLVNNLNTKLNGFTWCPFEATICSAPHLFPMDRCTFTKKDGTSVAVSLSGVTFKLNGNTSVACGGDAEYKGRSYGLQDATFYANNIAAGAITTDKLAAGVVTADKIATGTITVGNMSSDAQSEMLNSNIEVGGRNIALRTATMPTSGTPRWVSSVAGTLSTEDIVNAPVSGITKALRCTNGTGSATRCGVSQAGISNIINGDTYTLGCWVRASAANLTINARAVYSSGGQTAFRAVGTTTTSWQYVRYGGDVINSSSSSFSIGLVYVDNLPNNGWFEVCAMKVEQGNKETAWTPAPEDVEAENAATYATQTAASSQTQRVYYRTSSSTAPTASSTWVTSTSTANNTWSTKRMQYDSTYKYLWTCIQTKTVSGTVTNSTVLLDDTTTVIDGGNIITGTVDANQIKAGAITAEKINSSVDMATNAGVASTYATKTNAVKREQRIYRKNNSTTAPTAPTSWITSTSVTSSAWTTKRMSYDASYPYLWTCLQTETNDGTISCSTVLLDDTLTVIDGGNIITGSVAANAVNVTDLSAFQATIGGWNIDTYRIYKEFTSDGYVYQVLLNAPPNPVAGNIAIGIRKRATDSETWTYLAYFNYGGQLISNDATIRGTIVSGDFTANGKVRIAPDYDLQEAGVYALELVDQFNQSTVINPDFANFATFPNDTGVHIDASYVSVRNYSGATDTRVELENLGAGNTGLRITEGNSGQAGYKASYLGADQLVVNGKDIFADNAKIKQTVTTTSADYPVLFGATAITQNTQASTVTDESRISGGIFINPSTATINARRIHTGTTSQYGRIVLGNNIPSGTAGCSHGEMYIYCKGSTYVRIADVDGVINANRTYRLPNQSGYLMVDAVTTGTPTSTSNVSYDSVTWTKVGKTVRLSGTFYFATSTSAGTLFTGLPTPASEMTIIVAAHDNVDWGIETLKINTSGEIVFGGVGTHLVDTGIQFVFDTTYISAS